MKHESIKRRKLLSYYFLLTTLSHFSVDGGIEIVFKKISYGLTFFGFRGLCSSSFVSPSLACLLQNQRNNGVFKFQGLGVINFHLLALFPYSPHISHSAVRRREEQILVFPSGSSFFARLPETPNAVLFTSLPLCMEQKYSYKNLWTHF